MKSPGGGIPPYELDKVLGRTTLKPLHEDDFLYVRGAEQAGRRARAFVTDSVRDVSPRRPGRGRHRRLRQARAVWVEALARCRCARRRAGSAGRRAVGGIPGARRSAPAARSSASTATSPAASRSKRAARRVDARMGGRPCSSTTPASISRPTARARASPLDELPIDQFRRMVEVNLLGTFQVTQVFGGAMAARGGGSIINIGSLYASVSPDQRFYDHLPATAPFLKSPAYGASKAGVVNLTKFFATQWGRRAAFASTRCRRAACWLGRTRSSRRKYGARVPLGRMAEAEDLKGPLVFLASAASSYVTGHELRVDGGFTAW